MTFSNLSGNKVCLFKECIHLLFFEIVIGIFTLCAGFLFQERVLYFLALVIGLCFLATLYFFRNPKREIHNEKRNIISPADGTIVQIKTDNCKEEKFRIVSIFLTLLDVHVNRIPVSGKISWHEYHKGYFHPAFLNRASKENENNIIAISIPAGMVMVKQIAGLLARRIICRVHTEDMVEQGECYGMIMFGSRVDIYFPLSAKVLVNLGERVRAGESIIGVLSHDR